MKSPKQNTMGESKTRIERDDDRDGSDTAFLNRNFTKTSTKRIRKTITFSQAQTFPGVVR